MVIYLMCVCSRRCGLPAELRFWTVFPARGSHDLPFCLLLFELLLPQPESARCLLLPGIATFLHTVFLPIEVAPEYRPPPIRSRIKHENFILKAIAYRISSNRSREITAEKTYKPRPVFEETRQSPLTTIT